MTDVRRARLEDLDQVLISVRALIRELSGNETYELSQGARKTCDRLIRGDASGGIYLAWSDDSVVGVMTISIQEAIRAGGPYAEIQELWVAPAARGQKVGAALVAAGDEFCRMQNLPVMEVGLPPSTFANFERTSAFYADNDFALIGPRRRRVVPEA